MGEAIYAWRQGVYGKFLYLLFNIAVNLKLLFKKCIKKDSNEIPGNLLDLENF